MNNNIQCSIESSTTKIELNSAVDGVFLVPELEGLVGLPEIRTTSGVNAGYDGGWTSAQNYDARLISIRGVIANPDISKVEDKRRAIASLLGQGRKEQLTLRFTTEAGNAYAISVRTISCEMALQRVLTTQEFLIQLRADDPLIYDDGTTGGIAAILQPQRALGGFEINFGLPLAIGGGAEDTVVDNGNETVYPVIKLYGALHSPTVVNRTTNQQMQILADLQYSIDWHTYRSATGAYILVSDGLNGAPMTLSQLTGNAEQTTYSGKNLFSGNFSQFDNQGGTGSIYAYFKLPTDGAYTLTLKAKNNVTSEGTMSIGFNNTGGDLPQQYRWVAQISSASAGQTFSHNNTSQVNGTTKCGYVCLYPATSATFDWFNNNFEIQLESGSTATAYEPYVGGIPAPNPQFPMPISTVTGAQTVTVTGKNLLDTSDPHNQSAAGMTATWNNGVVEVKGTNTATSFPLSDNIALPTQIKAGTEISASFVGASVGNTVFRFFNQAAGQYEGFAVTGPNTSGTYTLTRDADAVQLYKGSVPTNTYKEFSISNWQIEYGSTATAYELYHGQSYEVNLGKNLLNINSLATTDITVSDGAATGLAHQFYAQFGQNTDGASFIKQSGQLSISLKAYTDGNASTATSIGLVVGVVYTDETSQITAITFQNSQTTPTIKSFTTTAGKDVAKVIITYANIPNNRWHISEFQIEKGGQATTYAPYFTPIELVKIGDYQDRIYKEDGKWYIEKQVEKATFDGSNDESWTLGTTGSLRYPFGIDIVGKGWASSTIDGVMCDTFTPSASSEFGIAEQYQFTFRGTSYNNRLWFFCPKSAIAGSTSAEILASYKTFLSAHPTTVYYALATPTTTEITDDTLRAQLNFLASLYEGENNISLMGTGAQGEMAISYATDYTVNQDVITIDSQARTITLNGQDVYHLKTSESEFLVLAPGENKLYLTSEVSDDSGYAEVKFKQGYLSI